MFWNEDLQETYLYTFAYGKTITSKLNYFVEIYGFFNPEQKADNRINGGFTYLVNKDFMLDTSAGIGLSEISANTLFHSEFFIALNSESNLKTKLFFN
jgi:hypothetical protein